MNNFEKKGPEPVNLENVAEKERETEINIGDVYFDKGVVDAMIIFQKEILEEE
ncbi:hypothetical protein KAJ41_01420 [Candidatus Parcubacteria bacterium]|nr:hypothetical protein [Candidatus Parcubacteria bacterium]